jgi:hypothetical protein
VIFPWIWRVLPGNGWVKALLVLLGVSLFIAVLFLWIFPFIDLYFTEPPVVEAVETGIENQSKLFRI